MFHALKTVRTYQPSSLPRSLSSNLRRETSAFRFRQASAVSNQPEGAHKMDKAQNPIDKTGNVMSHSFGEGYASRSDEEGFGGIYSGNQSASKIETDKFIHENHPAYDKTQGSEVKEKEQARNQTSANS